MPADSLAVFRVLFAAATLWLMPPLGEPEHSFTMFSGLPQVLFDPPPGPIAWLPGWPSSTAAQVLQLATLSSATSLLLGYQTRLASLALSLLLLTFYGLVASLGKVDHAILFCLTPGVLAFSGWGSRLSVDAVLGRAYVGNSARALAALAYITAFAMATAGLAKLGWLSPFEHGAMYHAHRSLVHGRIDLLAVSAIRLVPDVVWKLLDWATVAAELAPLALFVQRRRFVVCLAALVFFHLSVAFVFNIAFVTNVLAYGAFVRWPAPAPRQAMLDKVLLGRSRQVPLALLFAALMGAGALVPYLFWLLDQAFALESAMRPTHLLAVCAAAVVTLALALRAARARRHSQLGRRAPLD